MSSAAAVDDENSLEEVPGPLRFEQSMKLFKPLGIRVRKSSLRVSFVQPHANSCNCIFVGDKIQKINTQVMHNHYELQQTMKIMTPKAMVKVERGTFSWCEHLCTTIEVTQVSKSKTKASGRAIDLYNIYWHCHVTSELIDLDKLIGASIRYDARERVQIVDLDPEGLAAVHLQLGDVIHEVNEAPIASKTMMHYRIRKSIVSQGYVKLKVERLANGGVDTTEQTLMAPDVVEIGEKQLKHFETATSINAGALRAAIGTKATVKKKASVVPTTPKVLDIQSDYDPSDLKPCKKGKESAD